MIKNYIFSTLILILSCCSNSPDFETGEINTVMLLKNAFVAASGDTKVLIDAKTILSRQQIDKSGGPVLFVELNSGKNGTLTPYPGQGVGQTWLGADGATITLDNGILKASRGMGDDVMGATSSIPSWKFVQNNNEIYTREVSYLTGNNKLSTYDFKCKINKNNKMEPIEIWDLVFYVTKFEEECHQGNLVILNTYFVDKQGVVRKSKQFHSQTLGYIHIERIDR